MKTVKASRGFLELIITVNLTQIKITSLNLRNIHFFRKTSHWRFSYHIIVTLLSLEEQLSLWSFNFPPFSWQHVLLSISGVEKAGPLRFNGGHILMQFLTYQFFQIQNNQIRVRMSNRSPSWILTNARYFICLHHEELYTNASRNRYSTGQMMKYWFFF